MFSRKPFIILASLLFAFSSLYGQETANRASDSPPMLYRGMVAKSYPSDFNGTPYWDTLSFRKGSVMYNGRLYDDVLIKIDAEEQKLVIRQSMDTAPTNPDGRQVEWFTRGDDFFVNLQYIGIDARAGFYQLIADSTPAIFKRVDKFPRAGTGNHNGALIGYRDPHYNGELTSFHGIKTEWWKLENGLLIPLRPKKAKKLASSAVKDGSFTKSLPGWHGVDGTGSELTVPSTGRKGLPDQEELPEGYFSKHFSGTLFSGGTQEAKYKNKQYIIGKPTDIDLLVMAGWELDGRTTHAAVSGVISDDDGNSLAGVLIVDENSGSYTSSKKDGRFVLSLPVGETVMVFSDPEKEEQRLNVSIFGDGSINVVLHDKSTLLNEAVISAESMRQHRSAGMGMERISALNLSKIPTAFGEKDLLKAVLSIPGVQDIGELSSGFNVRGGSTDQNLILLNGNTIFYPSHFFGVNSAFNPDLVSGADLYKGSVPLKYGGRISSVLDVQGRSGNPGKVKGSLGLGLLTSRFHLEGPLGKAVRNSKGKRIPSRTTFNMGVRSSYSDWLIKFIPAESEFAGGSASFFDVGMDLTHKKDNDNSFSLFSYLSSDSFSFSPDTSFRYSNANFSIRGSHSGEKTDIETGAGFDHYQSNIEETHNTAEAYSIRTGINQGFLRLHFIRKKVPAHKPDGGVELLYISMQPGKREPIGKESKIQALSIDNDNAFQASAYIGDEWSPSPSVSVTGGVRGVAFYTDDCFYAFPEIRLSGRYSISPTLSLKAAASTMSQFIHLISNTTTISPLDTWKLSDKDILPTTGWQASSGAYWTIMGGKLDLSAEVYWKRLENYLDYGPSAHLIMNENLVEDLVRTRGKAYGVELMARKSVGKLNGWLSYTWSRSLLQDSQYTGVMAINHGQWYNAPTDKPHDLKMMVNYAFTKRYGVTLNMNYNTGRPVTFPVGYFRYGNGYRVAYSMRNAYRIPDYFRMDVALNIEPGHYLKALAHTNITLGCYNVTGRKNAYSVFCDTRNGIALDAYKLSIFATRVPYINLTVLF